MTVMLSVFGMPGWEADFEGNVYYHGHIRKSCVGVGVHTIVCTAWHGPKPPDKVLVAHRDDNRSNNAPSNLYWATKSENMHDAVRNGKYLAENNGTTRLLRSQIPEIRLMLREGKSHSIIADIFGVAKATITDISTGRTWRNH